jgi:hypothetical protein
VYQIVALSAGRCSSYAPGSGSSRGKGSARVGTGSSSKWKITAGRHDAVIITDPARISRNVAQLQDFADHCHRLGTRLYLTTSQEISENIALYADIITDR